MVYTDTDCQHLASINANKKHISINLCCDNDFCFRILIYVDYARLVLLSRFLLHVNE